VKVVLLWTGRGLSPEAVEELQANMGLIDSDEVCLVAWQRSGLPLPVSRHLVIGLHRQMSRGLATDQGVQRRQLTPEPVQVTGVDGLPAVDDATATEEASAATVALAKTASHTADLPVLHPSRVRQAVAWRARRVKRSDSIRALRRHPLFRAVRNQLSLRTALGFAASCLLARDVHDMTREADLVVGLDTASQRGAWTLAQKVPGPDVVMGVPAAKRLLEQHRPGDLTSPDRG
jgi:hypothetical protein